MTRGSYNNNMLKEYIYKMQIQTSHIDASKHVNNACYLTFFENARWDIFKNTKYRKENIHSLGLAPVLIECNLRYRKELVLAEKITIKTQVLSLEKNMIINMKQIILNEENKKICVGKVRHGLLNLKSRKMIKLDTDWLSHLI